MGVMRRVAGRLLGVPEVQPEVAVEHVYDEDPLVTVIISAKTTVDEILAKMGPNPSGLHDDLIDLRLILMTGVPDGR